MTRISFGGIGVEIMAYRTEFEIEMDQVNSLTEQISRQTAVAQNAVGAVSKIFDGDLQKLSSATDLTKNLTSCKALLSEARREMDQLRKLMAECGRAQERAQAAMPDFTKFMTNGRLDVPPGRTFSLAAKNAGDSTSPFELPTQKPLTDQMANLFDVHLSRRFQK